jgi:hypothetical protein
MSGKPAPRPVVEAVVDRSPEARASYLAAIKLLVQHVRAKRVEHGTPPKQAKIA